MPHCSVHWSGNGSFAAGVPRAGGRWLPVVAAAMLWIACPATAAVYKWTDANGRVLYSDQPPPANVKSETLAAPPPPANPNAAKELAQQNVDLRKREAQRAETDKKAEQTRADAETRRTQCTQAQSQIGQLSGSQILLYRTNDKGERTVMDDTARRSEIERLRTWVRENCGS